MSHLQHSLPLSEFSMMNSVDDEALRPLLPKDIFRSKFSWAFYNNCDDKPIQVTVGFSILIAAWVFYFVGSFWTLDFGVFFLIPAIYIRILIKKARLYCEIREMMSSLFLKIDAGVDLNKWDLMACKMNNSLYVQGRWGTAYLFFDCIGCLEVFLLYVVRPSTVKSIPASAVIAEARERYLQAVHSLFASFLKDEYRQFESLPRDEGYARFSYKDVFITFLAICFQILYVFTREQASPLEMVCFGLYSGVVVSLIHSLISNNHFNRLNKLDYIDKVIFSAAVTHFSPKNDLEKWDQVARYMNHYLHTEGVWKAPKECVYDGKDCLKLYKSRYFGCPELKDIENEADNIYNEQ